MDGHAAKQAIIEAGWFDAGHYLDAALSQAAPRLFEYASLLDHYMDIGWRLGLDPSAAFSVRAYRAAHPDVAQADVEPLGHYALQGRAEGRSLGWATADLLPKTVAFYLPQFHPDAQNEQWWGKGFTEWSNVTRATPQFEAHVQPILPGELGFYDLRVPEIRMEQASLARAHGVEAFCYYHYWFAGRTVLERPLQEVLRSGEPDFPFCLCWANENWTRAWDGRDADILLAQKHSVESDYGFIYDILPALTDRRYLHVGGRPLLLVYRPDLLAEPARTAALWREVAVQAGLNGLHLAAVDFVARDPRPYGFDSLVEFPPHHFPSGEMTPTQRQRLGVPDTMKIRSYPQGVARSLQQSMPKADFARFPAVMPGWDNTARRMEHATVFHGATPALFRLWTTAAMLRAVRDLPPGRRLLFVNAWNEWAEGAVLEPRRDLGRASLEALARSRQAVDGHLHGHASDPFIALVHWLAAVDACSGSGRTPVFAVGHDAQRAGAQILLSQLLEGVAASRKSVDVFTILMGDGPLTGRYGPPHRVLHAGRFLAEGLRPTEIADLVMAMLSTRARQPILCNTVVAADYVSAAAAWELETLLYVHELPTSIRMYVGGDAFLAAARLATRIVTVSRFSQAALVQAYPALSGRVDVIHAGAPPLAPEPAESTLRVLAEHGIDPQETIVLGCGAIHPRKGVDLLPAIVEATMRKLGRAVRFIWCGSVQSDGEYLRWIEHDLLARGLRDRVVFTGLRDDAAAFYPAAQVFILPSREDPFPLVALEAARAGLAIVMFDGAGGAAELLDGLEEAKAPYGDVGGFADRLVHFLRHEPIRRYVGQSLQSRVQGPFSWDRYVDGFSAAWLGTAEEPRPTLVAASGAKARVSVLIPFYDHGRFIEQTVASVAGQSLPAYEIIMIDDGSRPEDRERCQAVAARHSNVRFASRPNRGAHATINECLDLAEGEFIAILNSDDTYHPRRLEQLVKAAELSPGIGLFATECEFIDEAGRRFDQGEWYREGWRSIDAGGPIWLALLRRNVLMTTSNFFGRRGFFRQAGPFRDFRYAHDADMLQRMLLQGEIGLIRSPLLQYRLHGANTIRQDVLGLRTEIAQVVAEAYAAHRRRGSFTATSSRRTSCSSGPAPPN